MQVGSELRITQNGDIRLGNPTVEPGPNEMAANAVLTYYLDPLTKEHVIRLVDPLHTPTESERVR